MEARKTANRRLGPLHIDWLAWLSGKRTMRSNAICACVSAGRSLMLVTALALGTRT
jgi:hypothetical protein